MITAEEMEPAGVPQATDSEMTELLGRFGLGPWLDRLECGLD